MKIKDIKIGDWVAFPNPLSPSKNEDIGKINTINGFIVKCGVYKVHVSDIHPIPLTKEILEKNGWAKNKNENYVNKKYCFIEIYPCSHKAIEFGINIGDRCMIIIDSVHELQHLLWVLGIDDDLII